VALPPKHHLTKGAPQRFTAVVEPPEAGTVTPAEGDLSAAGSLRVRWSRLPGGPEGTLRVTTRVLYCAEGAEEVCLAQRVVAALPLTAEGPSASRLDLAARIPGRATAPLPEL